MCSAMCNRGTFVSKYKEPRSHGDVPNRLQLTRSCYCDMYQKNTSESSQQQEHSAFLPIFVRARPEREIEQTQSRNDKGDERELFSEINLLLSDLRIKSVVKVCK